MGRSEPQVYQLKEAQVPDAVDILCAAFRNYPMLDYFFGHEGENAESCMRRLFDMGCRARIALDWPLLGCEIDGKLQGVAYGTPPDPEDWPADLATEFDQFFSSLSEQTHINGSNYNERLKNHRHPNPHHYLHAIGVLPEAQGQGVGKLLLEAFQALSIAHPISTGVGLDTEVDSNVKLYESVGYVVEHHLMLDDVPMWFMFRGD